MVSPTFRCHRQTQYLIFWVPVVSSYSYSFLFLFGGVRLPIPVLPHRFVFVVPTVSLVEEYPHTSLELIVGSYTPWKFSSSHMCHLYITPGLSDLPPSCSSHVNRECIYYWLRWLWDLVNLSLFEWVETLYQTNPIYIWMSSFISDGTNDLTWVT